ncbi:hypothetical protein BpHYR1_014276 [Brachionus plicatilis]|uniref:Uncharacterized protein n=1 Tax=Brachionus plicatilis TaxID=10195 RepID=A0A3M7P6C9_BRAPC|nr:hypothetical protein BpHYR1_014276 [Brachionus plicatilis]
MKSIALPFNTVNPQIKLCLKKSLRYEKISLKATNKHHFDIKYLIINFCCSKNKQLIIFLIADDCAKPIRSLIEAVDEHRQTQNDYVFYSAIDSLSNIRLNSASEMALSPKNENN